MRALAFLRGARALDAADVATPSAARPEPTLPALATTPERAAAWRRWAAAGLEAPVTDAHGPDSQLRRRRDPLRTGRATPSRPSAT